MKLLYGLYINLRSSMSAGVAIPRGVHVGVIILHVLRAASWFYRVLDSKIVHEARLPLSADAHKARKNRLKPPVRSLRRTLAPFVPEDDKVLRDLVARIFGI